MNEMAEKVAGCFPGVDSIVSEITDAMNSAVDFAMNSGVNSAVDSEWILQRVLG